MFSFLSQAMLGLDISPGGLYLLQLRASRKGYLVEAAAFAALPDAVFAEGQIMQWEIIQAILQDLVRQMEVTQMTTAIHLPFNLVRMQQMQLPEGMKKMPLRRKSACSFRGISRDWMIH